MHAVLCLKKTSKSLGFHNQGLIFVAYCWGHAVLVSEWRACTEIK